MLPSIFHLKPSQTWRRQKRRPAHFHWIRL